jgi:hypothetical protein
MITLQKKSKYLKDRKLHKPHPGNILKNYQLDLIIEALTAKGIIKKDNKNRRNI